MSVANNRGMLGEIKKFNKKEHDIYDNKAKSVWIDYLNNKKFKDTEYQTIENPNKHGIDVLTFDKDGLVAFAWELEVRFGNWKGDVEFPFKDINCIERKDYQWKKEPEFIDKIKPYRLKDKAIVYYVQFNDLCNRAVIINGNTILNYDLKRWENRYSSGEYVRQVPISQTTRLKL